MGSNLELLVEWYRIISSENSGWQERSAATKSLEDAKQVMQIGCINAGLQVSKQVSANDPVEFFGLHLIEYGVLQFYCETADRQQQITQHRDPFMLYVKETIDRGSISRMTVEKIAQIISNFAKTDWPYCWPELLQQLHTLGNNVITMTAIRKILEDIRDSTTRSSKSWTHRRVLSISRRKEMIDAVRCV